MVGRKQERHMAAGNGLSKAEWRGLPQMLIAAKADGRVWRDAKTGNLIFVMDGADDATKIVVDLDPRKAGNPRLNKIDTAFRVRTEDVAASIKGGKREPL